MKKLLVLTMVIALSLMVGSASAQMALWEFEEGIGTTAADSINNNDGTLGGAVLPTWVAAPGGKTGGAIQMNGWDSVNQLEVDSIITVATDTSITPDLDDLNSAMTVACWVKDAGGIMNYPALVADGPSTYAQNNGDESWLFGAYPEAGWIGYGQLYWQTWHGGVKRNLNSTAAIPSDGLWHHVAATYDGVTKNIYIDGQLAGTGAAAFGAIQVNELPVTIGGCAMTGGGSQRNYNGQLDGVQIFGTALSAAEVDALVPEPMTMTLLGLGSLVLLRRKRV